MGTTTNYGFHYAEDTDPPDGATQGKTLAQDVDAALKALANTVAGIPRVEAGTVSVTPSALVTDGPYSGSYYRGVATVTFSTPFSATPSITATAYTGYPGKVLEVTIDSPSATSFQCRIARADTTNTIVHWQAISQTQ